MPMAKAFSRIIADETLLESAQHGSRAYPFEYYYEDIWDFDFHCVDWHWHPELELVYVKTGSAVCRIGDEKTCVTQGQGLLINSSAIHRFESSGSTVIPNAVFSPRILAPEDSLIYQKFVRPFLNSGAAWLRFDPSVPWQETCIRRMIGLFEIQEGEDELKELRTAEQLLAFWEALYPHLELKNDSGRAATGQIHQARLQIMMQYIQEHYRENICLEDIAGSVHVGKSTALQIFRQGINMSPVAYLIRYRLKLAAGLLTATEQKASAIAEETGFQSAGYFCRKFKELYGTSPQEYRKRKNTPDALIAGP